MSWFYTEILYPLHSQFSSLWTLANIKQLLLLFSIFISFLQGGLAVEFSFVKQGVAGVNFEPVSYNIFVNKANMIYIDRHLLTKNLNK